jgi:pantothenate kinase
VTPPVPPGIRLLGITGAPGVGKSTFAASLGLPLVPMDGFHYADVELVRRGLRDRKGAPETFDAWGYAALLDRVRSGPSYPVYAPGFERDLEQPIAAAIAIAPDAEVIITEGNYLLLDRSEWRAVRSQLDEVWYVFTDDRVRRSRLLARHVAFGKSQDAAREWVDRVDEPNARLVVAKRHSADRVIDLTSWRATAVV